MKMGALLRLCVPCCCLQNPVKFHYTSAEIHPFNGRIIQVFGQDTRLNSYNTHRTKRN